MRGLSQPQKAQQAQKSALKHGLIFLRLLRLLWPRDWKIYRAISTPRMRA
jgi:hypothetical protein